MELFTKFLPKKIVYTGSELRPHFIAEQTGHFGSAIVAFCGPCKVATDEMVDVEDRFEGDRIEAAQMLHFLGEWFDSNLELAIVRQRLLIARFAELVELRYKHIKLVRSGNDLYLNEGKLSVSIVTATPVSTLFHFGVNIDSSGAPVRASSLGKMEKNPSSLAKAVLTEWKTEWDGIQRARCKVSPRF